MLSFSPLCPWDQFGQWGFVTWLLESLGLAITIWRLPCGGPFTWCLRMFFRWPMFSGDTQKVHNVHATSHVDDIYTWGSIFHLEIFFKWRNYSQQQSLSSLLENKLMSKKLIVICVPLPSHQFVFVHGRWHSSCWFDFILARCPAYCVGTHYFPLWRLTKAMQAFRLNEPLTQRGSPLHPVATFLSPLITLYEFLGKDTNG